LYWNLHGQAEDNHEILVRLVIVPAQIVTAEEHMLRKFTLVRILTHLKYLINRVDVHISDHFEYQRRST
jgi:hypothetical protein